MKRMRPGQEKLVSFKASDTTGGTVIINGRVEPYIKEWLETLPEGKSYHVRQALRDYYQLHYGSDTVGDSETD